MDPSRLAAILTHTPAPMLAKLGELAPLSKREGQ